MGVTINISDFKCLNQLRNGEDFDQNLTEFTPNLVGNVGEKVQISFTVSLSVEASAEGVESWNVQNNKIVRSNGNFKEDGLLEGNKMIFTNDFVNKGNLSNLEFEAIIDSVSSDGSTITFTLEPGDSQTSVGDVQNVGIIIAQFEPENISTASLLRFGLIGNDESFNFISKTSTGQQVFYAIELAENIVIDYDSQGKLKDWLTGGASIKQLPSPNFLSIEYQVIHEFVLNPWFILSFKSNLLNDTVPELLEGDNSLKYAFDLEFRQTLTNIASSKSAITEDIKGVVGWFGENFNGFNNDYVIDFIDYFDDDTGDDLDGIGINNNTRVVLRISRLSATITPDVSVSAHVALLPVSESKYQQTETDLIENFLFDSLTVADPATSNTGTGIIKSLTTTPFVGTLILEYVITYDTAQRLRLTEESEYMTWIQIEDSTISTGNSDRVAILADLKNYVDANFVADFLNFTKYDFLTHELERGVDPGKAAITDGINEDGIALSTIFSSDDSKNVVINAIRHVLIARNTVTGIFFDIDSYDIDIGNTITDGNGVQQFTINVGRGYDLLLTDQFNRVELLTTNLVGNDQFYEGYFGQKISWQDWISNALVDTVFFDSAEPNDNLNLKTSNYSQQNSYEIFLATMVNVTGDDDLGRSVTGDFIELGNKMIVNDYSSEPAITGVIETLDPDTLQSLGGAVLYNGRDTFFRVTYTRLASEPVDYAIHRLEPALSLGTGIQELSSLLPFPSDNILVPLSGETLLKVTDNGLTVITECLISGAKVQEGIDYKLSSRIATGLATPPHFVYTVNVTAGETISLPMFNGDDSLYDFTVTFGDNTGEKTVTAYADTDREHTYVGAGTFDIRILGTFDRILFADSPDSIIEVKEWGPAQIGNSAFFNCTNFTTISATDSVNVFDDSLNSCFEGCSVFNGNVSNINTVNTTLFTDMFRNASLFNQPVPFDTSSGTSFSDMFRDASAFNQSVSFDTSNVTTTINMFNGASAFNKTINFTGVLINNVSFMFAGATAMNSSITISSSVVTTFQQFLFAAANFNATLTVNTTGATTLRDMFRGASVFNQSVPFSTSNVTNMSNMFKDASSFNQPLSFDTSNVTEMVLMFDAATSFDQDLSGFDVTALTDASSMFISATLSTTNYDALLVGWEAQAVNNDVDFDGGNSKFTGAGAGGTARAALIADHSWIIVDGGSV